MLFSYQDKKRKNEVVARYDENFNMPRNWNKQRFTVCLEDVFKAAHSLEKQAAFA